MFLITKHNQNIFRELLNGPKQVKHYLLEVVEMDKTPRILVCYKFLITFRNVYV